MTKLRYQGYTSTPTLWRGNTISQFEQIELSNIVETLDDSIEFKNRRLGKLVEEFVIHQLKQQRSIHWICENLQIQNGKQTIGEIDALYFDDVKPIHLEIVYKFYLYDTLDNYNEPLGYWIGPNRRDSLLYKLDKLHSKQFPLLYNKITESYLENYNLDITSIKQKLCFKAQLFLPYQNNTIDIISLNRDCIVGFYISFHKIELFKTLEFYIPNKLDWLVVPHLKVDWESYSFALKIIKIDIINKRSPLVWVKQNNNELFKCFITFW